MLALENLVGSPVRIAVFTDTGKPITFFGIMKQVDDEACWIDSFGEDANGAPLAFEGQIPSMDGPTYIPRTKEQVITELSFDNIQPLEMTQGGNNRG